MEPIFLLLLLAGGMIAVAAFIRFRRLWNQLVETIDAMAEGRRPPTFVFSWSHSFARLGARLEEIASESDRMRRRIEEAQFSLQAILSSMAEGLVVVDSKRAIRLVNDSFLRLFGLKNDPLGRTMLAAIREPAIEEMVKASLGSPGVHNREIPVNHPGRPSRFLAVSAVGTRDANGDAVGAVVVFHDITELRQAEEVRREFVANVSHELRTPLAIFQGYIETLLEDPDLDREGVNGILTVLQRHSKRLNALVEDLLTLARIESARIGFSAEWISLPEVAGRMAEDWRRQFAERKLTLDVVGTPDLPEIFADPVRIEQVLNNLIDNAAKHTPPGGVITLAIGAKDDSVQIDVADTGRGIPAADLPHIFDRFYRVEKDRSRETGGTGIGLSIVKRIVEMHGGRVEASSKAGQGTTMTFFLPVAGPGVEPAAGRRELESTAPSAEGIES